MEVCSEVCVPRKLRCSQQPGILLEALGAVLLQHTESLASLSPSVPLSVTEVIPSYGDPDHSE